MCVCMCVCMYVCMYVCTCMYVTSFLFRTVNTFNRQFQSQIIIFGTRTLNVQVPIHTYYDTISEEPYFAGVHVVCQYRWKHWVLHEVTVGSFRQLVEAHQLLKVRYLTILKTKYMCLCTFKHIHVQCICIHVRKYTHTCIHTSHLYTYMYLPFLGQ